MQVTQTEYSFYVKKKNGVQKRAQTRTLRKVIIKLKNKAFGSLNGYNAGVRKENILQNITHCSISIENLFSFFNISISV